MILIDRLTCLTRLFNQPVFDGQRYRLGAARNAQFREQAADMKFSSRRADHQFFCNLCIA